MEAKRLLGIFDLVKEPGNHPVFLSPAAAEERQRSRLEECFFLVKGPGKGIPFRWMLWIEELQFLHPYLFGALEAESPILGGTDFFKPGKVQQTGCSDLSRPTKMSSKDFLKKKIF